MCGDVDDEDAGPLEEQLYARFMTQARILLEEHGRSAAASADALSTYMDKLFADALSRCVRDSGQSERPYRRLAAQPLVLARLAGFLAGNLALEDDPLRKVMEALLHGYTEAQTIVPDHGHDHLEAEHGHGHDHHH
jgi:hypothetical protein